MISHFTGSHLREFVQATPLKPTKLNHIRVDLRVKEGMVKEGGIFSSSYITYLVTTSPLNLEVRRKDSDFYFLRKMISKQFPHIIIPPLPQKSNKLTNKHIKKREKYYTRFLQALGRSEELKSSKYLVDFLSVSDLKVF